tara:strand:- start:1327 stop:2700 length:1374 start_codon:yes stop_codon:yes gene_type:complete
MADCNTNQYRIRQLLSDAEPNCGELAYLDNTSGGLEIQVGITMDAEVEMFENDVARASLTKSQKIPKAVKGMASFNTLLKGSGALTTQPEAVQYFEGCGMSTEQTFVLDLSGQSGSFTLGEVVTGGTSGEVGTIVLTEQEGTDIVFVSSVGAFTPTETLTGGTSGATAVLDAVNVGGYLQKPVSSGFKQRTIRSEEDGFSKEMNGALGTFSVQGNANEPLNVSFEYSGRVPNTRQQTLTSQVGTFANGEEITDGTIIGVVMKTCLTTDPYIVYRVVTGSTDGFALGATITGSTSGSTADTSSVAFKPFGTRAMTTGVTTESGNPPILQHAGLELNGFQPNVSAFTLEMGNEVVVQENFNEVFGLAPATINAREVKYTLDPLVFNDTDWAIYDEWRMGKISDGFGLIAGRESGNRVFIYIASTQTQGISDGDRDGSSIFNIEGMAIGEDDAEMYILWC